MHIDVEVQILHSKALPGIRMFPNGTLPQIRKIRKVGYVPCIEGRVRVTIANSTSINSRFEVTLSQQRSIATEDDNHRQRSPGHKTREKSISETRRCSPGGLRGIPVRPEVLADSSRTVFRWISRLACEFISHHWYLGSLSKYAYSLFLQKIVLSWPRPFLSFQTSSTPSKI
jgi:hypothetical protein